MSEMVGLVAIKVFLSHGYSEDAWAHLKLQEREEFYRIARDILTSIREPTDKMMEAGAMELPDYDPGTDDSKRCWQNMIDAALK